MRFLVIGDPHFREGCVREMELFTEEALRIVRQNSPEIEFVVVLGDVMDRHGILHQKPFHQSCKFLIDLASIKKTYCLIGNHDFDIPSKYLPENHPYKTLVWNRVPGLVIVEKPMIERNILFSPYVPPGDFPRAIYEALSETIPDQNPSPPWDLLAERGVGLVFAHQEFRGCQMGKLKSEVGDLWGEGKFGSCPFVVSGHIHDHQLVGENVFYTGTPIQVNYGEAPKKGICVMDIKFDPEIGLPLTRGEMWFEIRVPRKIVKTISLENIDGWVRKRFEDLHLRYSLDQPSVPKPRRKRGKRETGFETIYDLHSDFTSKSSSLRDLERRVHEDKFLDRVRLQILTPRDSIPVCKIILGKLRELPLGLSGVFLHETERNPAGELGQIPEIETREKRNWLDLLHERVEGLEGPKHLLGDILREMTDSK